jgi:NhaP-type Na+/H+ or K+/H+ antiporter
MDAFLALANIAIILLLGSLCSLIAKKLRISDVLVLLLLGILLGRFAFGGQSLFEFDSSFLLGIGVLALVMVAFDSASRFRIKEKSAFSHVAFRLIGFFALFSLLLLPIFTSLLFFKEVNMISLLLSTIFALVVVGTDLGSVVVLLKDYAGERVNKIFEVLKTEAILSTLMVVILPFIVIDILKDVLLWQEGLLSSFGAQLPLLLFQLIIGLGAGVVVGLIILRTFQRFYSPQFSPISLIAGVLVAYLLAESIGGNGTLSVAVLGFLFGSFYVKEKPNLQEFSSMLSSALEILVFVILGIIIKVPLTADFIFKSLLLFVLLLITRFAAVFLSMKKGFAFREKLLISLNMPKGLAVAVIIFALSLYHYAQLDIVLQIILAITIYALILSSIIDRFSNRFIQSEPETTTAVKKSGKSNKTVKSRRA